jgi:hypothetical protein
MPDDLEGRLFAPYTTSDGSDDPLRCEAEAAVRCWLAAAPAPVGETREQFAKLLYERYSGAHARDKQSSRWDREPEHVQAPWRADADHLLAATSLPAGETRPDQDVAERIYKRGYEAARSDAAGEARDGGKFGRCTCAWVANSLTTRDPECPYHGGRGPELRERAASLDARGIHALADLARLDAEAADAEWAERHAQLFPASGESAEDASALREAAGILRNYVQEAGAPWTERGAREVSALADKLDGLAHLPASVEPVGGKRMAGLATAEAFEVIKGELKAPRRRGPGVAEDAAGAADER